MARRRCALCLPRRWHRYKHWMLLQYVQQLQFLAMALWHAIQEQLLACMGVCLVDETGLVAYNGPQLLSLASTDP